MLYRRQRNLSPLLVALALLVGLALGFLTGRVTAPDPTLATIVAPAVQHARKASGALEIVDLEYERAKQGNATSHAAAVSAARQAQAELGAASLLRQLDPGGFREAQAALADLLSAVNVNRDVNVVRTGITRAQSALRELQAIGTP
ncbi:hypothetical protein [Deinococcus yavapaiensis]|uniref:Uncharacterized protein n=1 Tax=Deinococcus yavapaiensis KR-236 TaxID=694435 RepID=A0A318S867_9DEIO|nr:hypothetical protein [Deinococcus yavapaiensis]PYE54642.1 hypothetical protein DES52_105282 [Deinococcus yavapaiensis KR-236]